MRGYSDVVVVANRSDGGGSPLIWTRYPQTSVSNLTHATNVDPFNWVCNSKLAQSGQDRCSLEVALQSFNGGKNWTIYGNPVNHCFARPIGETCRLQFNGWLMIAVVVCGVVKVLILGFLVFSPQPGRLLRTIGDAIASFLQEPDPVTKDMCLVSSKQIRKHGFLNPFPPQPYSDTRPRWFTGANTIEFFASIGISALYILILAIALRFGIRGSKGFAFTTELGVADMQSLASFKRDDTGSSGIIPTVLIANIPQFGLSILYFVYLNIWNKLLVAVEFDRYTYSKKGLRVSERPRGMQRASRFFTLPVLYALPLLVCSAVLHWLCSQSFFMVRIDGVNNRAEIDPNDQLVRLGYSAKGIVCLICVSAAILLATICVATFRRLRVGLGETSMSVVISAACHSDRSEPDAWLREVQWGDVSGNVVEEDGAERHCAFTTGAVERPSVGSMYR